MLYGIFTYIWAIFEVNVGEYSIHGAFGIDNYDIRRISWFTWGYLGWFPTSKPWFPIYYMKAKHISVLWQAYPVLSWRLQASYGGAHPVCGCEWAEWLGVPYLQTVYAARHIIYIYMYRYSIWVWINTYRYIFSGMNIHLPAILGFTRYQGFDPSPYKCELVMSCVIR